MFRTTYQIGLIVRIVVSTELHRKIRGHAHTSRYKKSIKKIERNVERMDRQDKNILSLLMCRWLFRVGNVHSAHLIRYSLMRRFNFGIIKYASVLFAIYLCFHFDSISFGFSKRCCNKITSIFVRWHNKDHVLFIVTLYKSQKMPLTKDCNVENS